uniref:protein-tyrosine-phosphatase n=1 Tax=Amphimedon queenslandica TaxID=400682 RepID=A0A1X7UT39_AMPQE
MKQLPALVFLLLAVAAMSQNSTNDTDTEEMLSVSSSLDFEMLTSMLPESIEPTSMINMSSSVADLDQTDTPQNVTQIDQSSSIAYSSDIMSMAITDTTPKTSSAIQSLPPSDPSMPPSQSMYLSQNMYSSQGMSSLETISISSINTSSVSSLLSTIPAAATSTPTLTPSPTESLTSSSMYLPTSDDIFDFFSSSDDGAVIPTPSSAHSTTSKVVSQSSSSSLSVTSATINSTQSVTLSSSSVSSSLSVTSATIMSTQSSVSSESLGVSPPIPTSTPTESSTGIPVVVWAPVGAGLGLLVIALVACMVIVGLVVLLRRRKRTKDKKKPRNYWESIHTNRHLGSAANVTMGHIAPLPRPNQVSRTSLVSRGHYQLDHLSKPMSVTELEHCLRYYGSLHDQYMSIPANMTSMNEIPSGAQEKNRYCDVLPNPNSRVVLFLKFGIANSDYINANFIRGYRGQSKAYIATQGPLPFTIADFWRMVWEQRTTVIIMTTGLVERNMAKCNQYWPDTHGYGVTETYGDIQVTVRKKVNHNDYTLTTFLVQHLERHVTREVIHYWYTNWPDMGVPDNPSSVVDFLLETRRSRESFTMPGPAVVHCSAGIGRTGVFIGADIGMRELEETQMIDVLRIVANMRQDRGGMVQTKDQYVFLHKILYEYAKRIGYVVPRIHGMNDFEEERYSENDLDDHIETTTTFV